MVKLHILIIVKMLSLVDKYTLLGIDMTNFIHIILSTRHRIIAYI